MDKSEKAKKIIRIIISVLILLTVIIIWGHSFMTREQSSGESGFVKGIVEAMLYGMSNEAFSIPEVLIRKSAHFIEYAVLGLELAILITINKSLPDDNKKRGLIKKLLSLYPTAFILPLITGIIDETIQYFTGRYSSIFDVLLDLCGASFSILIFLLIRAIFLRRRK